MTSRNFSKDGVLKTIYPYIKDKKVLDIGCVEHTLDNKNKERIWVHDFLKEHSKHVTGIDILKKDVEILKKQGYDVYCQSAETFKFNKQFDVIFAGELIEHLSNPGLFLQQCKKHLKKQGHLIITTPNAYSLNRFLYILRDYSNDPEVNPQHTHWHSPSTLKQLLERHNFKIEKIKTEDYPYAEPLIKQRIIKGLSNILGNKFKETLIIFAR